jgi:hypothetical protein
MLTVTCENPLVDARFPSEYAGFGEGLLPAFCAQTRPCQYACGQCPLEVGWARRARAMRLAPAISLDFSRSNSCEARG